MSRRRMDGFASGTLLAGIDCAKDMLRYGPRGCRGKMLVGRGVGAGVVGFRIDSVYLTLLIWVVGILAPVDGFAVSQSGRLVVEVKSEGVPIAGAGVFVSQQEVFTDQEGRARLELTPGEHAVLIFAEGYLELETLVIVGVDQEVDLLAELVPQPEIEEEIIVRASRTDRRLEDQPVRVEVVDREDIEEKALMTPGSVGMLLSETTGLRVQMTAPSTGAANVRIQGLKGRYSQMLSDGLPLYGLQGNALSLLQVPPLDLGQVEIIKGAASALYGPSALGGVINLVSMQPRQRHHELLLNASTQEAGDLTFWMVEPPKGNWAYTIIGGLHGQVNQDLDGDGWRDLPGYARGVVRPRVFWTGENGATVFSTFGAMAENRRGGTMPGSTAPDGQSFAQSLDTRRLDGGTVARIPLDGFRVLSVRGSIAYQGEDRTFGGSFDQGNRLTWFGEAVLQGGTGRHVWVIGGAIQQEQYSNVDFSDFDYNFVTPSFLAQDDITLSDKWTLGLSGRLDVHNKYGTFASPRVSLLYKPAANWTTRLSAGTGFFAPTPFVEEIEEVGLSRLLRFEGIVAEKAQSISFDTSWVHGPFELVGTVFASNVDRPVEREFVGSDRVRLANAEGPVKTWGTELLASYRKEGLLVLATHNYTFSTELDLSGKGRRDVPLNPRHTASFNLIWEDESWGRVGLETYYIGKQPLEYNPYRTVGRSYVLIGALAEKRFGSLRLFINFENLTNVRQTRWDPLLRPDPLPDGRRTVDAWAPLDGRVVNGGARIFF